jgi:hypothetical protein
LEKFGWKLGVAKHWDFLFSVASGGNVSQAIVFRKKIYYEYKNMEKCMFLSKYSSEINNAISSMFRTQYTPDFFVAEHYDLRNTIS